MKNPSDRTGLYLSTALRFLVYFGAALFFLGFLGAEFAARVTANPVAGGVERAAGSFLDWREQNTARIEFAGKGFPAFGAVSVLLWVLLAALALLLVLYTVRLFVASRELSLACSLGGALILLLAVVWWIVAIVFSVKNGTADSTVVLSVGAYLVVAGAALSGIASLLSTKKDAFAE